jgi:hypothetical protein
MDDELRKAGVRYTFATITKWLDEKKMVPLLLIAGEMEGDASAVLPCGPGLSEDAAIEMLRGFADALERKKGK